MTFFTPIQMNNSQSLRSRILGCVVQEGQSQPEQWVDKNMWAIVRRSDWVQAWAYAVDEYTVNQNPDTGARTDVISDAMILSAVQAIRTPAV